MNPFYVLGQIREAVLRVKCSSFMWISTKMEKLDQGPINIFCKGPDSKYFRLRTLGHETSTVTSQLSPCVVEQP